MLKVSLKYLLILLEEYFFYKKICEENEYLWPNYHIQIWQKLLKNNGFREPLPELSRVIEISKRLKRLRKKNFKVHKSLPNNEKIITKLFRDTAFLRHQKQQQLAEILAKFEKKTVHRFYPRVSKRYKNIKNKGVA